MEIAWALTWGKYWYEQVVAKDNLRKVLDDGFSLGRYCPAVAFSLINCTYSFFVGVSVYPITSKCPKSTIEGVIIFLRSSTLTMLIRSPCGC